MRKLDPGLFTEYMWEGGSVSHIFGFPHRYSSLVRHRDTLLMYAVGWVNGSELLVRPKPGQFAVMFHYYDRVWWNHFTEKEFKEIFDADNQGKVQSGSYHDRCCG